MTSNIASLFFSGFYKIFFFLIPIKFNLNLAKNNAAFLNFNSSKEFIIYKIEDRIVIYTSQRPKKF